MTEEKERLAAEWHDGSLYLGYTPQNEGAIFCMIGFLKNTQTQYSVGVQGARAS